MMKNMNMDNQHNSLSTVDLFEDGKTETLISELENGLYDESKIEYKGDE